MSFGVPTAKTFIQGSPQVTEAAQIPAPIAGMDTRTILARSSPLNCIYAYNLTPKQYGLNVRKGYREWQIDIDSAVGTSVNTIIPVGGTDDDSTDDRLFAVTNEGIWDVTAEAQTPVLLIDFSDPLNGGDTGPKAGYGVYTQYTTDADEQIVYYADSINGLFTYDVNAFTWARASGISGPDIDRINFVAAHKKQLWFIEQDASSAWYLPQGFIAGDALEFFFGSKFKNGGNLAGLFSWSVDGGEGIDDYFVAVSRAGDVIPYKGTDPATIDTWSSQGLYFIGALPVGNRFATEQGGNLVILSSYGLISMDDLLRGVDSKDINSGSYTLPIAALVRGAMEQQREQIGWAVRYVPSQGALVITRPQLNDSTYQQYVYDITTNGWGIWRDLPINCMDEWRGVVRFGTKDLRVTAMDVTLDDVQLNPPPPPFINGKKIDFSVLTTYQDLGAPAQFKRGKYVRAEFVATVTPTQVSKFHYDFNLEEATNNNLKTYQEGAFWDIDTWDAAVWSSSLPEGKNQLTGGWGMGRNIAIAMRGTANSDTTLVGWNIMWDKGNPI
jgi:hypothetical protein